MEWYILLFVNTVNVSDVTPKTIPKTAVAFLKNDDPEGVEKITSPLEPKTPWNPPLRPL
ncbi:MAG: hypothetical protein AAB091_04185 [Elusimicrobiota bacterium]